MSEVFLHVPTGEIKKSNNGYDNLLTVVYGINQNMDTTSKIVNPANADVILPSTIGKVTISSESSADTITGTGARMAMLTYLDSNYLTQTEYIALNGQSPVITSGTHINRIQGLVTVSAGDDDFNQGNMYVGSGISTNGVPSEIYYVMGEGHNVGYTAVRTVPADKTWYFTGSQHVVVDEPCTMNPQQIYDNGLKYATLPISYPVGFHQYGSNMAKKVNAKTTVILKAKTDTSGLGTDDRRGSFIVGYWEQEEQHGS